MNSAGQALIETIILTAIFMLLVAGVAKNLPLTFETATPVLAAQVESRLQTGVGFSKQQNKNTWARPVAPKGGMK